MSIEVNDESGVDNDLAALSALSRHVLEALRIHPLAELSVLLVDVETMTRLHVQWMDEPGPTDVLSFPQDDEEHGGVRILGDVVMAPAVAARNNPDDPAAELRLLLVHGILHILGYDHETAEERAAMWARQERYSGVRTP